MYTAYSAKGVGNLGMLVCEWLW